MGREMMSSISGSKISRNRNRLKQDLTLKDFFVVNLPDWVKAWVT
jgi:hypothetical protein